MSTTTETAVGPRSGPNLTAIANGTTVVMAATFFGLGLNYAYSIFLARYFGPDGYGLYALGLATFSLLSIVAVAGLDSAALKFVTAGVVAGDGAGVRRTVGIIVALSVVSGCVFGGALLLGSGTIAADVFRKPRLARLLMVFALAIPAYAVSSVLLSVLQAFQEVRWRTLAKYVSEPVTKIVLTVVLVWAGAQLEGALVALLAALILSAVLTLVPLRRSLALPPSSASLPVSAGAVVAYSWPILLALAAAGIAAKADLLLLGVWRSPREVGLYSAAFQTAGIITLVLQSFESIANPLLSASIARRDKVELDSLYKVLLRWVLIISLPAVLLLGLFPEKVLLLFGKEFGGGTACLVILVAGHFLNAATGPANSLLLFSSHTRLIMWNTVIFGLLQIVLNLVLVPKFGAIGAAIAASASFALVNVVRVIEVHVLLGVQPYETTLWKPLAAAAGSAAAVWLVEQYFHVQVGVALLSGAVAVYFLGLVALGLHDDDIAVIRAIVPVPSIGAAPAVPHRPLRRDGP